MWFRDVRRHAVNSLFSGQLPILLNRKLDFLICMYMFYLPPYLQLVELDQVTIAAERGEQAALFRPEVRSSTQ